MQGVFKPVVLSRVCFFILVPAFFLSCIGAASHITLNQDGSGSITLEFRVALEFENMGKLDGNEKELPVPVGKMDLERSAARVPGLRLLSYTSRQDGVDMVHRAELSFDSPEALSAFFDADGFKVDLPGRRIVITFPGAEETDPAFTNLLTGAFKGYDFSLSLSVPGSANTRWLDGSGKNVPSFPGTCSVTGKTVHYTVPMADMVFLDSSLMLEISW